MQLDWIWIELEFFWIELDQKNPYQIQLDSKKFFFQSSWNFFPIELLHLFQLDWKIELNQSQWVEAKNDGIELKFSIFHLKHWQLYQKFNNFSQFSTRLTNRVESNRLEILIAMSWNWFSIAMSWISTRFLIELKIESFESCWISSPLNCLD